MFLNELTFLYLFKSLLTLIDYPLLFRFFLLNIFNVLYLFLVSYLFSFFKCNFSFCSSQVWINPYIFLFVFNFPSKFSVVKKISIFLKWPLKVGFFFFFSQGLLLGRVDWILWHINLVGYLTLNPFLYE